MHTYTHTHNIPCPQGCKGWWLNVCESEWVCVRVNECVWEWMSVWETETMRECKRQQVCVRVWVSVCVWEREQTQFVSRIPYKSMKRRRIVWKYFKNVLQQTQSVSGIAHQIHQTTRCVVVIKTCSVCGKWRAQLVHNCVFFTHTAKCCNALQPTKTHCNTLQHTAAWAHFAVAEWTKGGPCIKVCCSVLQCVAVCCSVLRCVAVCCSVLQCVAVCCSVSQCVAVCRSVLQCASELQSIPVCCNVSHCVAVQRSVLQCVAVCVKWVFFTFTAGPHAVIKTKRQGRALAFKNMAFWEPHS